MTISSFNGKTAVVTGASGAIGCAIVRAFALAGANVVAADLDRQSASRTIEGLGGNALAVQGDVADENDVEAMLEAAFRQFGSIDILINNAGVALLPEPTIRQDLASWRRVVDINLQGVFLMARGAARRMLGRDGGGVIVNVASVAGLSPAPGSNDYSVTKAAVVTLTETLATEWARKGIRVNAVAPGIMDAGITRQQMERRQGLRDAFTRRIPMGRLGEADDVTDAVLFLSSDHASYITGVCLPVDGGFSAARWAVG